MIKNIHFIWVNKHDFTADNARIPKKYRKNIENWKKLNPDWKITLWNGPMIHALILSSNNPDLIKLYLSYSPFICKVDLAKLVILGVFGGLYLDMDYYCQRPIDYLFGITKPIILVKEPYYNLSNYESVKDRFNLDKYIVSNAFIYSDKSETANLLLTRLINLFSKHRNNQPNVLLTTGPVVFNEFYSLNKEQVILLEPEGCSQKKTDGYCYTTFDNTWCSSDIFNPTIFEDYYFYPCLYFNNYHHFRDDDIPESLKFSDILKSKPLAFNTDRNIFYSVPPLTSLIPKYDTEMRGTFINKTFFKRKNYIPRIIHQIWIGPRPAPKELMKTWETMHPDWDYRFWNEETIENVFPGLLENPLITKCHSYSGKADIIRYHILQKFGGIYIDADTECLKELPNELLRHNCFFVFESEYERGTLVNNSVIGCLPNNPIWDMMLKEFEDYDETIHDKVSSISYYSPGYITRFLQKHLDLDVMILPSYYFSPTTHDRKRENTFLMTQSIGFHVGCVHPKLVVPTTEKVSNMSEIPYLLNHFEMKTGLICTSNLFYLEDFLKNWNGRLLKVVCSKKDLLFNIGQILLKDYLYKIEWLDIDNFALNSKKLDFMIFHDINNPSIYGYLLEKSWENMKPDSILFSNNIVLPEDSSKLKGDPPVALPVIMNFFKSIHIEPTIKMFGERPIGCLSARI
jgi:mannosyltransferase OCH1-like enzyme